MTLADYEEEILMRMYDEGIINMSYRPIQVVRAKINWLELSQRYRIRKGFHSIMRRLENKGYVSSHGKSGDVCALTQLGVLYVLGRNKERGGSK